MPLFRRREETLNEKLLREAGYTENGEPVEQSSANDADDDESEGEIVFTLDAPDLLGDSYEIVTLPDASVLVDEAAPDVSDVAEAVEQDLTPPYRASAVRQSDGYWLVKARPIDVESLSVSGGELELSVLDGEIHFAIDGGDADVARIPSRLMRVGEQAGTDFIVRATRLDGDLWEVRAGPL